MLVPNKHGTSRDYRFGFNGKENDNEVMGEGNFQDYGMRMFNPRIGRFFNVDPLTSEYPELTPYQFASNTPLWAIDIDGLEGGISNIMGGGNVVSASTAKAVVKDNWFSQPAARWMKLGLAAQMNAIQPTEVYNENSFPGMTKGEYVAASMAQAQINHNTTSQQFVSGKRTRLPQQPHIEVENKITVSKLKVGTYEDIKKVNYKTGNSADHIPSFASLKKAEESVLGRPLNALEEKILRNQALTLSVNTKLHQTASETYGGKNNKKRQEMDALKPLDAIKSNVDKYRSELLEKGYSEGEIDQVIKELSVPFKPKKR